MPTTLQLVTNALGPDRSADGIARSVSRLVSQGILAPDTRLPTVRTFAAHLGVSPSTVSQAWKTLRRVGVIEPRGRNGTVIVGPARSGPAGRHRRISGQPGSFTVDLSTGIPDPALLPDLGQALGRVSRRASASSYLEPAIVPALEEFLRQTWPFTPESLTVVDGALDALDRIARAALRFGDVVAVENPTYPAILDLLDEVGARPIPIELDEEGVVPGSLDSALSLDPVAVFLQPRAQNPTGVGWTVSRTAELARLLAPSQALVVEDDHAGDIAIAPLLSIGSHLPGRTIHVRGISKAYGPDLRLAAVGGAADVVDRIAARRVIGPGWSSRLLQHVLLDLLTDPVSQATVARARETYAARRGRLVRALNERDVWTSGSEGINLWVRVLREQHAMVSLAADGIGVAPGSAFQAAPLAGEHIRVTVGLVRDSFDLLAERISVAGNPGAADQHRLT